MSELTLLFLATKFTSPLSVEFFHQWHKPGKKWFCAGLYKLLSSVMNSATTNIFPFKKKEKVLWEVGVKIPQIFRTWNFKIQFPSLNCRTLIYSLHCENKKNSLPALNHKVYQSQKVGVYMCLLLSIPGTSYAETHSLHQNWRKAFPFAMCSLGKSNLLSQAAVLHFLIIILCSLE